MNHRSVEKLKESLKFPSEILVFFWFCCLIPFFMMITGYLETDTIFIRIFIGFSLATGCVLPGFLIFYSINKRRSINMSKLGDELSYENGTSLSEQELKVKLKDEFKQKKIIENELKKIKDETEEYFYEDIDTFYQDQDELYFRYIEIILILIYNLENLLLIMDGNLKKDEIEIVKLNNKRKELEDQWRTILKQYKEQINNIYAIYFDYEHFLKLGRLLFNLRKRAKQNIMNKINGVKLCNENRFHPITEIDEICDLFFIAYKINSIQATDFEKSGEIRSAVGSYEQGGDANIDIYLVEKEFESTNHPITGKELYRAYILYEKTEKLMENYGDPNWIFLSQDWDLHLEGFSEIFKFDEKKLKISSFKIKKLLLLKQFYDMIEAQKKLNENLLQESGLEIRAPTFNEIIDTLKTAQPPKPQDETTFAFYVTGFLHGKYGPHYIRRETERKGGGQRFDLLLFDRIIIETKIAKTKKTIIDGIGQATNYLDQNKNYEHWILAAYDISDSKNLYSQFSQKNVIIW